MHWSSLTSHSSRQDTGPSARQPALALNSRETLLGQLSYQKGHTYSVFSLDFDLLLPFGYLPRVLPTCTHPCCLCPAPAAPEAMDMHGTHWILAIKLPWDGVTKRKGNTQVLGRGCGGCSC